MRELKGIVFQSDGQSDIGRWVIRPFESLDRKLAGLRSNDPCSHAMHAGLHVVLDDGRDYVAEQLVGSIYKLQVNGLCWTPYAEFRQRDRGGWDVTVPATSFRGVDEQMVRDAVARLNQIKGRPFWREDCTGFIERSFGERQLFADSPTLRSLGIRGRLGDPALPLLRRDVRLDPRAEKLLDAGALRALPDPGVGPELRSARLWAGRTLAALGVVTGALVTWRLLSARHIFW